MDLLRMFSIVFYLCLLCMVSISSSECGRSSSCQQGYVFGGLSTCAEEFPWNAALVDTSTIVEDDEIKIFCGASIVSANFLISAGHCFKYRKGEIDRTKDTVRVYIGLDHRLEPNRGSTYHFIESQEIYPDWLKTNRFDEGHDIAIIKVATPIEFTPIVSPICLPSIEQEHLVQVGISVKMAGFGTTASSNINGPQNLLKGGFKIVDCAEPKNICAAQTKNGRVIRDTCNGDSGGGLVAEENGSFFLVGIVSWGRECGDSNFTTRYVNVLDHLQWIKSKIEVCFSVTGSKCILPFRLNRKRHDECISSWPTSPDKTFPAKCPTRVDSRGEGGSYKFCNSKCPGFKKQVHGVWQSWSSWTGCSGKCQSGLTTRFRNCSTPQYGGHSCKGDRTEEELCDKRKECEIFTTTVSTTDKAIAQTKRKCSDIETCETRENCPYVQDKYAEILASSSRKQKKSLTSQLKTKVCNTKRKGFCCPQEGSAFSLTPCVDRYYNFLIQSERHRRMVLTNPIHDDVGRDIKKTRDEQVMPEAMADFTQAFYNHMANKSEGKNFAFSPLSLHSALTLLYLGATKESQTERELKTSLFGLNARGILESEYKRMIDFYKKEASFNYGNRIWTKKDFQIKQNYTDHVLKNLGADSETTDFNGKCSSEFDPDTKMFLANALYFKEDWQVDFSETDITSEKKLDNEPFYILDKENKKNTINVEMMEQIATSDTYGYGEIELVDSQPAKVVTIPYKNPNFVMQIICPTNLTNGMAILEYQMKRGTEKLQDPDYIRKKPLDPFNLFILPKNNYNKPIDDIGIKMPKFKISKGLDVSDILQDMGVNAIFQAAELDLMTDSGQLTVSKILHKSVIDVDHKGQTAAAATGIELVLLSASFGERIRVDVNQPFIFIIQDVRNNIPVMVGRVVDPRQTV